MSYAHSVTIGPAFFKKAFNDYGNKFWAFGREIMQNSIDCGSTHIDVLIARNCEDTRVIVQNDGEPMDHDTLVNKLLSLGESGKDFRAGAVGGFGKAKEILYFAHKEYAIMSGDWHARGSGAGYNLTPSPMHLHGTNSNVLWAGDVESELKWAFERFVKYCGTGRRVTFTLNGEKLRPQVGTLELARTLDHEGEPWAEVWLGKGPRGQMAVRVGGVPMFTLHVDYKGFVAIELLGTSAQRLTSNRDGLRYPYDSQLSEFITTIAVDKRTAFLLEKAEYRIIPGTKLRRPTPPPEPAEARDAVRVGEVAVSALVDTPEPKGGAGILAYAVSEVRSERVGLLGHEFVIKNCVRKPVPGAYDPESLKFSDYSHWCVRAWAGCLVELYDLFAVDDPFSVGFVFSDSCEAQSESGDERGQVYYLNPCHVRKRGHSKRYGKKVRHRILAVAAHEFIHGALGESYHGEDFAAKYTLVMSQVLANARRFNRHLA
jgi:hypothetical protein